MIINRICIVGGGNLSHTMIGMLSQCPNICIDLLTRKPEKWNHEIFVHTPEGVTLKGKINIVSSDPKDVIPHADLVILCLPAYCMEEIILQIKPHLSENTIVGSIVANTGFFIYCHNHLSDNTKLFSFQRVPYVSRIVEYGKEAHLLGYRNTLYMATENINRNEEFRNLMQELLREDIFMVDNFYEVTLSNSNPILHTGRLYTMWKDWDGTPFERCSLFYKEWTLEASTLEIEMDKEFFMLLNALNINTEKIETLLEHYESSTAYEMTDKITSIKSLSTILSPMKQIESGWVPDFESRYFTEDFPYGLRFIVELARAKGIYTPHIDRVYEWGMSKLV